MTTHLTTTFRIFGLVGALALPVLAPPELVAKYRAQGAPETGLHNAVYLAALEHLDASIEPLIAAL